MNAVTTNPDDRLLAQELVRESIAARQASESLRTRNILYGWAALAGAAGLAVAAAIWAWNQSVDPEAMKTVLAELGPIPVEGKVVMKDGTVTMKDGTVTLKPGGEVAVKPGGEVSLAPGGKVSVEGGNVRPQPAPQPQPRPVPEPESWANPPWLNLPQQTHEGEAIKRSVTVFNTVPVNGGAEIHTGWEFHDGKGKVPFNQYCYWIGNNKDGSARRIEIAINGRPIEASRRLIRGFDRAFKKCQWWDGQL